MSSAPAGWNRIGTLRDKVALVRCDDWILGFEARYVRQVGFADLVQQARTASDERAPAHVGRGTVGDSPCSLWDLGVLLGARPQSRAVIALERPGGVVALRCGEILAVETVATAHRLEVPSGLSTVRPGLFKAALVLRADSERPELGWLLRVSAMLTRDEIRTIQRDWSRVTVPA